MHYAGTGWKIVPDQPWKWMLVFSAMAVAIAGAFLFSRLTEVHTAFFRYLGLRIVEYFRPNHLASAAISESRMR